MRGVAGMVGGAVWLVSGAFAGGAWGWAAMRVAYRYLDIDSSEGALAVGVIFGLAVALVLWGLGWRELRG